MKIDVNATVLDEKPTGIGIYTQNILREWSLSGFFSRHEIRIFSSTRTGLPAEGFKLMRVPALVQPARYRKVAGLARFIYNQSIYPVLAGSADISYSPTPHGSVLLSNQVLTIHDVLGLRYPGQHKLQYYYYKNVLPVLIRRARSIITISECTRNDLVEFFHCSPEQIHVVPNGYDNAHFKPRTDITEVEKRYGLKRFILSIGATYPHKNLDRLVSAFAALPRDIRSEYPLLIAGGRENYISALREQAAGLGITDQVHFAGYVNFSELPLLYSAAALMVYPSLYEGFGLPPLEAMACGCPVISSGTSSLPEVCGSAARYIDPLSVDSITEAMKELLTSPDSRETLKLKGLAQAARFSWADTAAKIGTVIENA